MQQNSGGILAALKSKMNTLREESDNLKDERDMLKRELAEKDEKIYKVGVKLSDILAIGGGMKLLFAFF